ncbi:sufE-like protein 1, chloroplastic/mitochondrial [Prosopis cineraria]|uniref:sufE-like protein 1, chloroplastic/mitochondrial n=1 Tax=Prosopis cineraria TaxID=364024 RepID=UPI0024101C0E|nr:sufE-like protein 1, chloroplastic/mitochondrial [Prosopis cineraria]
MSANSISSCSFRLFTCSMIPHTRLCQTLFLQSSSYKLSFFKPITLERIPTKPLATPPSTASTSASLQPIEELPPKLQEIVKLFQSVQEPRAKYQQLLFYGKNLKPLEAQFKTRENKVEGCVSQVWVRAFLNQDKNVVYEADSDSDLTKGLAALLVQGLSGRPVAEVVRISPDFVVHLGLQQSLTPSRNNGFLNMLKLMQKKALTLYIEAEKGGEMNPNSNSQLESESSVENSGKGENPIGSVRSNGGWSSEVDGNKSESRKNSPDVTESNAGILGSRGRRIKEKLEKQLSPVELQVEDVSYQHAGHAGARGSDGETHFNLRVTSKEFEGKSLIKRHRLIYNLLEEELQSGLHALSIEAKTPSEVNIG